MVSSIDDKYPGLSVGATGESIQETAPLPRVIEGAVSRIGEQLRRAVEQYTDVRPYHPAAKRHRDRGGPSGRQCGDLYLSQNPDSRER